MQTPQTPQQKNDFCTGIAMVTIGLKMFSDACAVVESRLSQIDLYDPEVYLHRMASQMRDLKPGSHPADYWSLAISIALLWYSWNSVPTLNDLEVEILLKDFKNNNLIDLSQ